MPALNPRALPFAFSPSSPSYNNTGTFDNNNSMTKTPRSDTSSSASDQPARKKPKLSSGRKAKTTNIQPARRGNIAASGGTNLQIEWLDEEEQHYTNAALTPLELLPAAEQALACKERFSRRSASSKVLKLDTTSKSCSTKTSSVNSPQSAAERIDSAVQLSSSPATDQSGDAVSPPSTPPPTKSSLSVQAGGFAAAQRAPLAPLRSLGRDFVLTHSQPAGAANTMRGLPTRFASDQHEEAQFSLTRIPARQRPRGFNENYPGQDPETGGITEGLKMLLAERRERGWEMSEEGVLVLSSPPPSAAADAVAGEGGVEDGDEDEEMGGVSLLLQGVAAAGQEVGGGRFLASQSEVGGEAVVQEEEEDEGEEMGGVSILPQSVAGGKRAGSDFRIYEDPIEERD